MPLTKHKKKLLQECAETILVTSAINPGVSEFCPMSEPDERLFWTVCGLLCWIRNPAVDSIVFADCTLPSYDFDQLVSIAEQLGVRLELLLFDDNELAIKYGKGAGEGNIIQRAIEQSTLLAERDRFWKCTAKMYVPNFKEIAQLHKKDEAVFQYPGWSSIYRFNPIIDGFLRASLKWLKSRPRCWSRRIYRGFDYDENVSTQFFLSSTNFYRRILWDSHLTVRDSNRHFIEHAYCKRLLASGFQRFKEMPVIMGRSGSLGTFLDQDFKESVKSEAMQLTKYTPAPV